MPRRGLARTRVTPAGALHLWPSGGLFIVSEMVNEPHRHFTVSILVGLEGAARVRSEPSEAWSTLGALMVAPNVEQQLDARGATVAILQIDPESDAFDRIAHHFEHGGTKAIPSAAAGRFRASLVSLAQDTATSQRAFDVFRGTIDELASNGERRRLLDSRIRRVLALIKDDFLSPPPAATLAAAVGLSAGRLIHLFTDEMGLPIRRYVLWLRLRDVLISLCAGASLTEAAHHAGFSDSAHLSRTFRGMFGFPPSAISERGGRVRLTFDPAMSLERTSPHHPTDAARFARATTTVRSVER
jgi:AraC-like DNA-binding protein